MALVAQFNGGGSAATEADQPSKQELARKLLETKGVQLTPAARGFVTGVVDHRVHPAEAVHLAGNAVRKRRQSLPSNRIGGLYLEDVGHAPASHRNRRHGRSNDSCGANVSIMTHRTSRIRGGGSQQDLEVRSAVPCRRAKVAPAAVTQRSRIGRRREVVPLFW
jgi:hypothetical protein